jgi:IS5 family transposase
MISLHCLRIYLDTSYRMTIDLLKEMPHICREIGLETADLPHYSTLCLAFGRLEMKVCQVLLRYSAQLHDTSDIAAIDATCFNRSVASRHYCRRTNYRVQTLEVTEIVDTGTQAIFDLYCTATWEESDAEVCEQFARRHAGELRVLTADRGYDCNWLREDLRELGIRPLIRHCINKPCDHHTTPGSTTISTGNGRWLKPSSPASSARWAAPCEREPGTVSSAKSR